MCNLCSNEEHGIPRRDFIKTVGVSVAGVSLGAGGIMGASEIAGTAPYENVKKTAVIRGAFLYPPTNKLDEEGYYSWPGSDFKAEERQKQYMARFKEIEGKLGIRIEMDLKPLDLNSDVDRFIAETNGTKPDGLLLIPFKKAPSGDQVMKIINETKIPTVVLATLGVLLIGQIKQFSDHNGVYMINSLDNLDAVENGLKMIKTRVWLQNALIVNIGGANIAETTVPFLGTTVRRIPHQRFYDYFANTKVNSDVQSLANHYMAKAIKISQPKKEDIIESAKSYFIFKKILTEEKADALMMDCLPGLKVPHKHVPPCMGYMSLRDEGIAMGCESDLDATLSMMLLQDLFGKPGFQHNPSYDTENDCYFCAHCTSASKMNGVNEPSEPFELMSHAEAGWGTVPRVHFKEGQEVTIAKYLAKEKPQLLLYSGKTISCPPIPPTGACRTNVTATLNELEKGTDLKGHHLIMVYGNYVKQLKRFSQLFNIEVVV